MSELNLSSVIQSGDTIYTQCHSYDEWIPNVIVNTGDNLIKINLIDYYFKKGVMVGSFISVRYSFSEHEYVLEGEVTDIDVYDTYTISIFINNTTVYQNRRKHFRYYSRLGSNLKSSINDKGTYSILTNISYSGLAIISKAHHNIGDEVFIDLFQSSENIIPVSAQIVRKKALNYGYEYGVSFIDLSEDIKEQIKILISNLKSKFE